MKKLLLFSMLVFSLSLFSCRKMAINSLLGKMEKKVDECKKITDEMEKLFKKYSFRVARGSDEMYSLQSKYEDCCSEIGNIGSSIGRLGETYGEKEATELFNKVTVIMERMIKIEEAKEAMFLKYARNSED